ncbi:hypothetical protein [Micromonospora kangleipakensis]|uniref:hypothetical protein n=1 Tax=Micromonospora kangleipakensis TaxID=1077942 RepID=UPI0013EF2238|nr:hypothetical protein [Micromonospora kangleipakensis]
MSDLRPHPVASAEEVEDRRPVLNEIVPVDALSVDWVRERPGTCPPGEDVPCLTWQLA